MASAQTVTYQPLGKKTVWERLAQTPTDNGARAQRLSELFQEAGCESVDEQAAKGSQQPNVVCTLVGQTQESIVVGAHFDSTLPEAGVLDNWSGAALLPSLYESLRGEPRKHTLIFAGFTDEKNGLVGSRAFVRQVVKKEKRATHAMVNLECLGAAEATVWQTGADPVLRERFAALANSTKTAVAGVNVNRAAETDSLSFEKAGVPSITIHGISKEHVPLLHTTGDSLDLIDRDRYYETYKFLAAYIALLDTSLGSEQ